MSPQKKLLERLIKRLDLSHRQLVGDYLDQLAREKVLLESIFNNMQEGVMVIDEKHQLVMINRSAGFLLDLPSESRGRPLAETVNDPVLLKIVEEGFEIPGQVVVKEIKVVRPMARWIRLSRSSLWDGEGIFRGILLLLTDFTRQRNIEQAAGLADRLDFLSYLTAAVAHELGNPLSSLSIHAQLIERLTRDSREDKLKRSTRILREEINRLDEIVSQFLKALRPARLNLSREDIKEVLEQVLGLVEEELKAGKIKVKRIYPRETVWGDFDRNMIKQVILNLVKNSAQAMHRGGLIKIRVERQKSYIVISISDQGGGIPADKLGDFSKVFFSGRKEGGGLGLLVVYKIIRQHGGTLEIKSETGVGTEVIVRLPQRPERIKLLKAGAETDTVQ